MIASDILSRTTRLLQDATNVRWTEAELLQYLSDAQREVLVHRPDALTDSVALVLIQGTRQMIPTLGLRLIDIPRNLGIDGITPGRAITMISRQTLDIERPDWHADTPEAVVKHFTHDSRDPRRFYVFPAAVAGRQVECVQSVAPAEITAAGDPIEVPEIFGNALVDYVMYRAYSKDTEYAGNAERAGGHYAAFERSLGAKVGVDLATSPQASAYTRSRG